MKYKSFNLTNFIGLKYFKPESIAEIKEENEKYKRLKKKEALKQTHAKITTRHCAKCKSKCEINAENYVYSYSEKKKEYRKLFLCENCLMKCKSCNKTSNPGIFVYIWNKTKSDYNKLFYCMDCYKKANLNQCANCKKRIDSEVIANSIVYCATCGRTNKEHKINSANLRTLDILKLNANDQLSNCGYKPGQKIKIYNSSNENEFVEVIWPKIPTVGNIIDLVKGG